MYSVEDGTAIVITAQGVDPRKYKTTKSLCFGYPRNFKPSKLTTLTVAPRGMAKYAGCGVCIIGYM